MIQADREAAAAYIHRVKSKRWSIEGILTGGCDNTSVVQAFASHRLACKDGLGALVIIRALLSAHEGRQTAEGEAFKIADATLSQHSGERS